MNKACCLSDRLQIWALGGLKVRNSTGRNVRENITELIIIQIQWDKETIKRLRSSVNDAQPGIVEGGSVSIEIWYKLWRIMPLGTSRFEAIQVWIFVVRKGQKTLPHVLYCCFLKNLSKCKITRKNAWVRVWLTVPQSDVYQLMLRNMCWDLTYRFTAITQRTKKKRG